MSIKEDLAASFGISVEALTTALNIGVLRANEKKVTDLIAAVRAYCDTNCLAYNATLEPIRQQIASLQAELAAGAEIMAQKRDICISTIDELNVILGKVSAGESATIPDREEILARLD